MATIGWDEWARLDGTALATLVRRGELTAREIAAQVAEGVARVDPKLNAVLGLYDDVIANPDTDHPNNAGVLYGVPVFVKDLGQSMAGRMQESGSKLWKGYVPTANDPLIDNALAAGLIPIGRSASPEFGMTFDTATDYLGSVQVTRNPWNPNHTPGGSSGGSAALVAAGVTPISLSSDGGGSTRIPASFSGLVGLLAARPNRTKAIDENTVPAEWPDAVIAAAERPGRPSPDSIGTYFRFHLGLAHAGIIVPAQIIFAHMRHAEPVIAVQFIARARGSEIPRLFAAGPMTSPGSCRFPGNRGPLPSERTRFHGANMRSSRYSGKRPAPRRECDFGAA